MRANTMKVYELNRRASQDEVVAALIAFCGPGIARPAQGDEAPGVRLATEMRDGALCFDRYILVWGDYLPSDEFTLQVDERDDFARAVMLGFSDQFATTHGGRCLASGST